jgi:hypothetical protein
VLCPQNLSGRACKLSRTLSRSITNKFVLNKRFIRGWWINPGVSSFCHLLLGNLCCPLMWS